MRALVHRAEEAKSMGMRAALGRAGSLAREGPISFAARMRRRNGLWIMRAIFGVVSLLLVLAVVGVLAMRQLRATGQAVGTALPAETVSASGAPAASAREQSQQLQQRVHSDVTKALEQGASARKEAANQ